ncbi:MAG: YciI family protein [Caulobacteraceae bacterium]
MRANDTYLAVYVGDETGARRKAWLALPEAERQVKEREGMAAWGAWMEKHRDAIVVTGGPLGKTKKVSQSGIADVSNALTGFVVVRAESPEAATELFERHPHFAHFPGGGVEIMPVLPIPGA